MALAVLIFSEGFAQMHSKEQYHPLHKRVIILYLLQRQYKNRSQPIEWQSKWNKNPECLGIVVHLHSWKTVNVLGLSILSAPDSKNKDDFSASLPTLFADPFACFLTHCWLLAIKDYLPQTHLCIFLSQTCAHYRGSPTSTNSTSTIFSAICVKLVLVEFLELAML